MEHETIFFLVFFFFSYNTISGYVAMDNTMIERWLVLMEPANFSDKCSIFLSPLFFEGVRVIKRNIFLKGMLSYPPFF